MVRHSFILVAALSLAACGGGDSILEQPASAALSAGATAGGSAIGNGNGNGSGNGSSLPVVTKLRGDDSGRPAWGGWAWGDVPADAVARAGFDWFETGYPGDTKTNQILLAANVRPFAYINLGELDPVLAGQAKYTGSVLRTNGDWGTQLVDVTDASWQDWLVRRADEAYQGGSRGIKWDVATPDVPPGKNRGDVNDAIASVMQRILQKHPDLKFVFNQGFEFALAYPQFAHGLETEGLFAATGSASGYLKPWNDPYYWGPQYQQAKQVQTKGVPVFVAEYADPLSQQAKDLYGAIAADGFVPYITSDHWNVRGMGLGVNPGW